MSKENESRLSTNQTRTAALISGDWFLQFLVSQANSAQQLSFNVSLNVAGMVVTGRVIDGKEYFSTFSEQFTTNMSDKSLALEYQEALEEAGTAYLKDRNAGDQPPPAFIHLKDARFFTSNGRPISSTGTLWRGRLSEISGFSLGILTTVET